MFFSPDHLLSLLMMRPSIGPAPVPVNYPVRQTWFNGLTKGTHNPQWSKSG
jgi:hypothetical protein